MTENIKMRQVHFFELFIIITISYMKINLSTASPYIVPDRGFCNVTYSNVFKTKCQHCDINVFTDCPVGSVKKTTQQGTSNCTYSQNLGPGAQWTRKGCYHECVEDRIDVRCCSGYWGPQCQECPGGVSNVCGGHGSCNDSVTGTGFCTCEEGYTGYACELCVNETDTTHNCSSLNPPTAACQNKTCPKDSNCVVVDGEATCMCQWPYVDHAGADNSTVNCTKVDMCKIPPPCHKFASCSTIHEPTVEKNCTCLVGYHGDGYVCGPVNPCQLDNGGCPFETSRCIYDSPGKSHCECLSGYTEFVPGHGCRLIDVCATKGSQCHPKATCKTTAPFNMICTCPEKYTGNGKVCYGNILQTIQDLNNEDSRLTNQLSLIQSAIEKYYKSELTNHGPFTVFLSSNSGFRSVNTANKWLDDGVQVRQVLRQHILVGEFHVSELLNQSIFYTLQGVPAELQTALPEVPEYTKMQFHMMTLLDILGKIAWRGDILKYRLHGSNRKAILLKKDVIASNGVIHVINRLMTNPPEAVGDEKMKISEVIAKHGQYNRLNTLLLAAGTNLTELLHRDNITVFAMSNSVLDALPLNSLEYLQSDEGVATLNVILKNHILDKRIEMAEMINLLAVTTMANTRIAVDVQKDGSVLLNRNTRITQADIEASNGLLYNIDQVLLPVGVSTLPNTCDTYSYKTVQGPCGDCTEEHVCYDEDVNLNLTTSCLYFKSITTNRNEKQAGCAAMCNRTYITSECCPGFYGYDCLSCPGGYQNPCGGKGKCDEGYHGNGTCMCDDKFTGENCQSCAKENYFGPNCTQECTCIHGTCSQGPLGNGLCDSVVGCSSMYWGQNCEKHSVPCNRDTVSFCHAHALCIHSENENQYSCICKPGYRGSGEDCVEIDLCIEKDNGGCDLQATCVKTGPRERNCTCNKGWTGDGSYCYPASSCSNHGDCDKDSQCIETTPGEHICVCNSGYHGDGKSCVLTDMCKEHNGKCHPKAVCVASGPGQVNCTCPLELGYTGNGYNCYGNIIMQIMDHPQLRYVANLLQELDPADLDLWLDDDYTVFTPTDAAIHAFSQKTNAHYWEKTENVITLLNYHTLRNMSNIAQWLALSSFYNKVETMADGFFLHIYKEGQIVMVSPRKGSSFRARVLVSDLKATNGYINIIDQVLEPYLPESPDSYPDLETFFNTSSQYSIFGSWLKEKGLIKKLEEDLDAYTLFVPSNEYARTVNVTVTTDFLRYYIVPRMLMTASMDDDDTLVTDLGIDHQLIIKEHGWKKMMVNNVPVTSPDIFTLGGIVNVIDGLLHPVLHTCNETVKSVEYGICHECGTSYLCPGNYTAYQDGSEQRSCSFRIRHWYSSDVSREGCQGLCVINKVTVGCCAGYYGPNCQECPGGPETPCNGVGHCVDSSKGSGLCVCDKHFTGIACDKCIHGWTGPNCDIVCQCSCKPGYTGEQVSCHWSQQRTSKNITDMFGCGYKNGGCHRAAVCLRKDDGTISCKCGSGYRGDGKNCTGPCELNNGGCHRNADCMYKAAVGVKCSCKPGFVGDGKDACNGDVYSTLLTLSEASQFVKSIQVANDGNDTLDTLQGDGNAKVSVFVPVDKSLKNRILNKDELQHHIVVSNNSIKLENSIENVYNISTLAGDVINVTLDSHSNKFLANGIRVVQANIVCTNGIIHLIASPFTKQPVRSQRAGSAPPVVPIVIVVVIILIVAAIVIVAVVIYKKKKAGYWSLFHKWVPKRTDSEGDSVSQARLHFSNPDSTSIGDSSQGNVNFGNPLYQMNDDDL